MRRCYHPYSIVNAADFIVGAYLTLPRRLYLIQISEVWKEVVKEVRCEGIDLIPLEARVFDEMESGMKEYTTMQREMTHTIVEDIANAEV